MKTIDELLDQCGFDETCEECIYYSEETQWHDCGETRAAEILAECECDIDEDCPRIQSLIEDEENEDELDA